MMLTETTAWFPIANLTVPDILQEKSHMTNPISQEKHIRC